MATTLEMLIRAKYISQGAGTLEAELRNIKKSITDLRKTDYAIDIDKFLPPPSSLQGISKELAGVTERLNTLKQAQQTAFGSGDSTGRLAGSAIEKDIKDLTQYQKILESIAATNKAQDVSVSGILTPQDTASLVARLREVRKEVELTRNALAKETPGTSGANILKKQLADAEATQRLLQKVVSDAQATKVNPSEFIISEGDTQAVRGRISRLETDITRLKEAARAAFAQGRSGDEAGQQFLNQAQAAETLKNSLEKTLPTIQKTGFTIENLLTNKLTRLGFGIFALQSSLRTFTSLVSGMFSAIVEGASALDRSASFEALVSGQGISSSAFETKLNQAGRGIVSYNEAIKGTIELSKAGFPEIAKNADRLLEIATAAAIVSGDLNNLSMIHDKLVRGIVRGSPRLIDDSGIVLKLGDANEAYAASLGKTVEQLTAAEKARATYNAVDVEGERIIKIADQLDSEAVKVAKLKSEWESFTTILKESLAITAISTVDTLSEDYTKLGATAVNTLSVLTATDAQISEINAKLLGTPKGWAALIGGAIAFVGVSIDAIIESAKVLITTLGNSFKFAYQEAVFATKGVQSLALGFLGLEDAAKGAKEESLAALSTANALLEEVYNAKLPNYEENVNNAWDRILQAAGIITGKTPSTSPLIGADQSMLEGTQASTEDLQKLLRERASMSEDIEYERMTKIRDLNRDHADKMRDIARKLADALADIDRDLANKLSDLAQDRADKLIDIQQDLADKMSDIEQDLADKLSDIQQDANDKRADAQDEYNKGLVDAEEEYQKKIRDIMRKYEASRLSALIDRDARALFEAAKQRDEDLQDAAETAEQKKKDELEQLQEKIDDINKAEEQQRQDAINNAEQRRRDAQQAADRARRDAQQNYERARRDAQQDADRRRREARENAAQERRDALQDQAKAREDLQNWYRDKLRDLMQFHQEELQQYATQYSSLNQMTGDFLNSQIEAQNAFAQIVRGNREWTGIGSPTDPTTGDAFPDWRNPSNVYVGGRCNRGSSQVTTGADGRQYLCINNSWQLFTGIGGGQSVGANVASFSGGGVSSALGGLQSGGRIKLVLEGNGDDALTNIIKSGAYDAFLEIIN